MKRMFDGVMSELMCGRNDILIGLTTCMMRDGA